MQLSSLLPGGYCPGHRHVAAATPHQHLTRQPLRPVAAVQQQQQQQRACHQPSKHAEAVLQQLARKGAACLLAAALVAPACGAADLIGQFGASGSCWQQTPSTGCKMEVAETDLHRPVLQRYVSGPMSCIPPWRQALTSTATRSVEVVSIEDPDVKV